MSVVGEIGADQLLGIIDASYRADGEQAQVGTHQQRLGIRVADAADTAAAVEIGDVFLKLGSERCILNVVDLAMETALTVVDGDTAAQSAEVRVIVRAEKNVQDAIFLGDCTEKASHEVPPVRKVGD